MESRERRRVVVDEWERRIVESSLIRLEGLEAIESSWKAGSTKQL